MNWDINTTWDQPVPLLSVPPNPFVSSFHNPNGISPCAGIPPSPPYVGITSPIFTAQVPPQTLSNLRIPPPHPPDHPVWNQWNPYIFAAFRPSFADLFDTMLSDDFNPGSMGTIFHTAIKNFRTLPLEEQLQQFIYSRTLSAEQVRIRWQIVLDLLFILRQYHPLSEVHAFGSVISGLGDSSSDIDIFVNLNLQGPPGGSSSFPASEALRRTKKLLSRRAKCPHTGGPFLQSPIIAIPKARVPILKLTHAQTLTNLDLSFENRLSAQNSKLMVLYTNLDPRVFRLMVIIRYWLKIQHLSGPSDIKNYALNLLVLVYLMEIGIIPSVHFLQNLRETQRQEQGFPNSDEINGWDASFCEELEIIQPNFRATPIPPDFNENPTRHLIDLALGFFKMCAHVDFSKVVVCPLLGEIILKGGFVPGNEQFLTDMLARYKQFSKENDPSVRLKVNSYFCVQDPFVLNYNVTGGATPATVIRFQLACAKVVEVMTEKLEEERMSQSAPTFSLLDLFLFTPLPTHVKNKDIIQCCINEIKLKRLKKEILGALDMPLEKTDVTRQKSMYVKLPCHLFSIDKLMEIESYQKWLHEQSSCKTAHSLTMALKYDSTFVAEFERCGLLEAMASADERNSKLTYIIRKMATLWKRFVKDFVDEFFVGALKLEVTGDIKEMSSSAYFAETEHYDGSDFRNHWRINAQGGVYKVNDQKKEKIMKKIAEIKDASDDEENYYRLMTIKVTYPFWRRPYTLEEWNKNGDNMKRKTKHGAEYSGNPIDAEALISEWLLTNFSGVGERKKKKKTQVGEEENKNTTGGGDDDGVQVVGEAPPAEKRARLDEDAFTPFNVDVLVKISTKLWNMHNRKQEDMLKFLERPYISIVYRSDKTGTFFRSAVNNFSTVLGGMFEDYQVYRLKNWIG